MITAFIVDDDQKNIRVLKGLLSEFTPQVNVIGEATTIAEAQVEIRLKKPDLLFLDIEMPYGNGFELLDKLMPAAFEVIFITAYDNHAIKAIKYCALDYLLKPVSIKELVLAVDKVSTQKQVKETNRKLQLLFEGYQLKQHDRIAVASVEGLEFINVDDIIRCESQGSYTQLFLRGAQKITTTRGLKEYEDLLPHQVFFRIHHSHLINISYIQKYIKGRGGFVIMADGTRIEVAARRKEQFLALFNAL